MVAPRLWEYKKTTDLHLQNTLRRVSKLLYTKLHKSRKEALPSSSLSKKIVCTIFHDGTHYISLVYFVYIMRDFRFSNSDLQR